jgi:hypothetical protein
MREGVAVMADLVVIVGVLVFFGIAALLVVACDRIIGPDESEPR